MPVCTVCASPHRQEIDRALLEGQSLRTVSQRYGPSSAAVQRHAVKHIPATLVRAETARQTAHATTLATLIGVQDGQQDAYAHALAGQLSSIFAKVDKLLSACDRYLSDPTAPDQYDLGPRDTDVTVVYTTIEGGKVVRKKEPLSALLEQVEDERGVLVRMTETRIADPRKLILQAADSLRSNLELMARVIGAIDERPQASLAASPEWMTMRLALLAAVERHPEARQALAEALQTVERQ